MRADLRRWRGVLIGISIGTVYLNVRVLPGFENADFAGAPDSRAAMHIFHWLHRSVIGRLGRPSLELSGPEAKARVYQETRMLVDYVGSSPHRYTTPSTRHITANQSLANARTFTERAGVSLDGWYLRKETYLDHGPGGPEYWIQFEKLSVSDGLPAAIDAFVDVKTGTVSSYSLRDGVVVPLEPGIPTDQAAGVATPWVSTRHPVAQLAELTGRCRPIYPDRQTLLWSVEDMGDATAPSSTLRDTYLDTTTGGLVDLMVKLEFGTPGLSPLPGQEWGGLANEPAPIRVQQFREIDLPALKNATPPPTIFEAAPSRKK
jgi:hypothetical protein